LATVGLIPKISKIRDRQKSKLLQTSFAAVALPSAAFIRAVGEKVCEALASPLVGFPRPPQRMSPIQSVRL
jgi:hypothetical protein